MKLLTRGEKLVNLYEIGRNLSFDHDNAFSLAEKSFDAADYEPIWYIVYFLFRKEGYNQEASVDCADQYIAQITELLDEQD